MWLDFVLDLLFRGTMDAAVSERLSGRRKEWIGCHSEIGDAL